MPNPEKSKSSFPQHRIYFADSALKRYKKEEISNALETSIQRYGFLDRYNDPAIAIAGFTPELEVIIVLYKWDRDKEAYIVYHAERGTKAKLNKWFGQ